MQQLALAALATATLALAAHAYSGEEYTVCNLDPNGDNWLALKAAPNINSQRIAKLGPGTPLLTWDPEPVGKWRQVTVMNSRAQMYDFSDLSGWVHTDYICIGW